MEVKGSEIDNFPFFGVLIKNLTLSDMNIYYGDDDKPAEVRYNHGSVLTCVKFSVLVNFLKKFQNSLIKLKLVGVIFGESFFFESIFDVLKNLRHLEVSECQISTTDLDYGYHSSLRSITITKSSSDFLKLFPKCLESFKYIDDNRNGHDTEFYWELQYFLKSARNIGQLTLVGSKTALFFTQKEFNFKLKNLDAHSLTYSTTQDVNIPRIKFLDSQKEYLRELKLTELPHDYDGGVVLKFIFEEMNLDKFDYGNTTLIVNSRKVNFIDEVIFSEIQVKAGLELMRQFPGEILFQF